MRTTHLKANGPDDAIRKLEEALLNARGPDKYALALQLDIGRVFFPWLESMDQRRDVSHEERCMDAMQMTTAAAVAIVAMAMAKQFPLEKLPVVAPKVAAIFSEMLQAAVERFR